MFRIAGSHTSGPMAMEEVRFFFDGRELHGYAGEPIAAALLANGIRTIRRSLISGEPRGIYCGIGHCYECQATVDGIRAMRTCLTPLRAGMVITSGRPLDDAEHQPD